MKNHFFMIIQLFYLLTEVRTAYFEATILILIHNTNLIRFFIMERILHIYP